MRHELFDELDAFNPRWKIVYPTLAQAARAAGAWDLYEEYIRTPDGREHRRRMQGVRDYARENALRAEQIRAERTMAQRGAAERAAGVIIDWDSAAPEVASGNE